MNNIKLYIGTGEKILVYTNNAFLNKVVLTVGTAVACIYFIKI